MNLQDGLMQVARALPASATAVHSTVLDLGNTSRGDFLARCEFLVTAPALTTTQLPNSGTMTYVIEQSADGVNTFTTVNGPAIVQTGAGGTGAAAATARYRLPEAVQRYIRLTATGATSVGDCSAASAYLITLF
jgi:hypothetical protein